MLKTVKGEENNNIKVSIIIPCRNEEKFIGMCLDSLLVQDYPKEHLEIFVVNGMSEDRTRQIVGNYSKKHSFIKLIDNPQKNTPYALNIGIKNAKGEIIIRMDAHATYQNDYISKCVKYLYEYEADNIGGTMVTLPQNDTFIGKAVVVALSHRFGVGGSIFRTGTNEPQYVDTVFGGCYKREVFNKIGLFNENLQKGQDFEFNVRLKNTGGKILLVPDIVSYYYARSALNKSFCKFYFGEGFWAVYPVKFVGKSFLSLWRLVPFAFVATLISTGIFSIFFSFFKWLFIFTACSYFLTNLYFSFRIAVNKKNFRYFFVLPLVFSIIHINYGIGSAVALLKLLFHKKEKNV